MRTKLQRTHVASLSISLVTLMLLPTVDCRHLLLCTHARACAK